MLDKSDEKTIEKIVVKSVMVAMDQLITPQLDDIYNKLEEHDKRFEKIDKKLSGHDEKFASHEEKLEELQMTIDRVEMKLDGEVRRDDLQDDKIAELDKKVLKLAKSKA